MGEKENHKKKKIKPKEEENCREENKETRQGQQTKVKQAIVKAKGQ